MYVNITLISTYFVTPYVLTKVYTYYLTRYTYDYVGLAK